MGIIDRFYIIIKDFLFPKRDEGNLRLFGMSGAMDALERPRIFKTLPITYSIFPYRNQAIKKLISATKYEDDMKTAEILAKAVSNHLGKSFLWSKFIGKNTPLNFIPIPLSESRLKERGFNQCERIIRLVELFSKEGFCKNDFKIRTDILERVNFAGAQAKQKITGRKENVKGVFKAKVTQPAPNDFYILFDDVTTTGSTLHEAAIELIRAGISENRIFALTVAA